MRTNKNLEGINWQRLRVNAVNFNYSHSVIIDGKDKAGVAGDRNQSESVAGAKS